MSCTGGFPLSDRRLWEIAENLHRGELTALERNQHVAEWIRLTAERLQSAQSGPIESKRIDGRGHRPPGGLNAAAGDLAVKELGVKRTDAQRAIKVASLSDAAKDAARDAGLDDNRSALLEAAKAPTPEAQVEAVKEIAQRGRVRRRPVEAVPGVAAPRDASKEMEAQVKRLMTAWTAAGPEARAEFLSRIDGAVLDRTGAGKAA